MMFALNNVLVDPNDDGGTPVPTNDGKHYAVTLFFKKMGTVCRGNPGLYIDGLVLRHNCKMATTDNREKIILFM